MKSFKIYNVYVGEIDIKTLRRWLSVNGHDSSYDWKGEIVHELERYFNISITCEKDMIEARALCKASTGFSVADWACTHIFYNTERQEDNRGPKYKSSIWNLLNSATTVKFLDVDGTLAPYEYGMYNHNACLDKDWDDYLKHHNVYAEIRPIKALQEFIKNHCDVNKTFVITKSENEVEFNKKADFVVNNYNIKRENIIMVTSKPDKLKVMDEICEKIGFTDHKRAMMIDDSVDTLTYIQENSDYSTVHVSTFLQ